MEVCERNIGRWIVLMGEYFWLIRGLILFELGLWVYIYSNVLMLGDIYEFLGFYKMINLNKIWNLVVLIYYR